MKKPTSSSKPEKSAKRTPEEKLARKSAKNAGRATAALTDERATKKASQKKSLKAAAKQLQKELNNRMNEVVARIRKETKAKLKEVVQEATRRMDGDTERMFEQALHTIVRHYDSVSGGAASSADSEAAGAGAGQATRSKQSPTINKDGTPRKSRATAAGTSAAATPSKRGRKPGSTVAPKPAGTTTGAKRGPKPRVQAAAASGAADVMNSADSPSTGEVSE